MGNGQSSHGRSSRAESKSSSKVGPSKHGKKRSKQQGTPEPAPEPAVLYSPVTEKHAKPEPTGDAAAPSAADPAPGASSAAPAASPAPQAACAPAAAPGPENGTVAPAAAAAASRGPVPVAPPPAAEVLTPMQAAAKLALTTFRPSEAKRLTPIFEDFVKRYPQYLETESIETLRQKEYDRIDRFKHVYLDYTGASLYGHCQLNFMMELLDNEVLGNPHSTNPTSTNSTVWEIRARDVVMNYFGASKEEYTLIWTLNSSNAIKIVGESYPFDKDTVLLYTRDNHNSNNGIREFARAKGCWPPRFVGARSIDMRIDNDDVLAALKAKPKEQQGLFIYPAQSNVSGVQHNLEWVEWAHENGWDVMLDASAFIPTNPFDFRRHKPDYFPVSFYKLFGFPTGVGALIAKKSALDKFKKPWFAGGTIGVVTTLSLKHVYAEGYAKFEDGTLNFLAFPSIYFGFRYFNRVNVSRIHERVMALTGYLLDELKKLVHQSGQPLIRICGPTNTEMRGSTIAFHVYDSKGVKVIPALVLKQAAKANISLRAGCMCNPGTFEMALKFGEEYHECMSCNDVENNELTLSRFATCAKEFNPGLVRVSFGIVSNFADVARFLAFLIKFFDQDQVDAWRVEAERQYVAAASSKELFWAGAVRLERLADGGLDELTNNFFCSAGKYIPPLPDHHDITTGPRPPAPQPRWVYANKGFTVVSRINGYCPFTQRVILALKEKNVPFQYVDIGAGSPDWYLDISPKGEVPALCIDGRFVTDSVAIIKEIERLHPEPSLYTTDPAVQETVQFLTKEFVPTFGKLMMTPTPAVQAEEKPKLMAALTKLDAQIAANGGVFLTGKNFTLADIMLMVHLARAGIMKNMRGHTLPPDLDHLNAFMDAAYGRPTWREVEYDGKQLIKWYRNKAPRLPPLGSNRLHHQAFRFRLEQLGKAVRELSSDPSKFPTFWASWKKFLILEEFHSEMEDQVFFKAIDEHTPGSTATFHGEHDSLHHQLEALERLAEPLLSGPAVPDAAQLAAIVTAFDAFRTSFLAHIGAEEKALMPIVAKIDREKHRVAYRQIYALQPKLRMENDLRDDLTVYVLDSLLPHEREQYVYCFNESFKEDEDLWAAYLTNLRTNLNAEVFEDLRSRLQDVIIDFA